MSNKTLDLQKEAGPIGNTKEMDSEEEAKTVILTDDDESSTNSDESSDDEDYIPCMSWEDRKKKNLKLSNFEGFEESASHALLLEGSTKEDKPETERAHEYAIAIPNRTGHATTPLAFFPFFPSCGC